MKTIKDVEFYMEKQCREMNEQEKRNLGQFMQVEGMMMMYKCRNCNDNFASRPSEVGDRLCSNCKRRIEIFRRPLFTKRESKL